ncbi:hypothetical protein HYN59_17160 [Flavobacterium album]|uniref:Sugar 3,4-ketoisomerase QdtA cupin domain-containing protein n=1 Tax=Flavobacterium album TaxID=2175091 RepID=A0A2S1R2D0_9FLAO|nr:FdtA/QdtA family cupin domain-containing protein [Flavobacterium album]AWH86729.1 hypothetical protein HYN59_17160 [Flavobacterium album]
MQLTIIDIPKVEDPTGNVGIIEKSTIPFEIKRVFYLYDIADGATRGRHAHKTLQQFIIAISGSFEVVMKDGKDELAVFLDNPAKGLLVKNNIWSELKNFSPGAVCLVLASDVYDEGDYLRNYDEYISYLNSNNLLD